MSGNPRRCTATLGRLMLRGAALALAVSCRVALAVSCGVSVTGVNFGAYDPFTPAPLDTTGDVAVTCAKYATDGNGAITVAYVLGLSAGSSNSVAQRTMQSGSEILRYNVYVNSARTTVWGDTDPLRVSGSVKLTNARPQATNNHAAYGRAPAAQDVGAGAYADTLILTMTF